MGTIPPYPTCFRWIIFHCLLSIYPVPIFQTRIGYSFGKYDNDDDPGEINHFQALSAALAGTVGMGNISGVAVAIHMGGPGALFWMWVSAFVGMSTKYFTCTLAILFRGKDD